eukprot:jgi/Chrzof1/3779/Cz13g08140.t1
MRRRLMSRQSQVYKPPARWLAATSALGRLTAFVAQLLTWESTEQATDSVDATRARNLHCGCLTSCDYRLLLASSKLQVFTQEAGAWCFGSSVFGGATVATALLTQVEHKAGLFGIGSYGLFLVP